jgi:hypothetical protein
MEEPKNGQGRQETFHWDYWTYDITALLRDLEGRKVPLWHESTFNRDEIETYRALLERVPHPGVPPELQARHRIQIDGAYASTLQDADLARPLILLPVGLEDGPILLEDLDDECSFVVADGNHRLVRAYHLGKAELPVIVIPASVAGRYRLQ